MCLNRENRRALKKKLRDKGSRTLAADVLESLGNEIDKKIHDGDLVTLNVVQIIARKVIRVCRESTVNSWSPAVIRYLLRIRIVNDPMGSLL